jgi:hypothetical protein
MWVNLQEIVLISYFMNKEPWSMNDTNIRGQRDLPHSKLTRQGSWWLFACCYLGVGEGGKVHPPPPLIESCFKKH